MAELAVPAFAAGTCRRYKEAEQFALIERALALIASGRGGWDGGDRGGGDGGGK